MRQLSDTQVYSLSVRAPGLARRRLADYQAALEPGLYDDLRIVTSELVSNAVLHSGRAEGDPITVTTSLAANVFRVDVMDWADVISVLRPVHQRRTGLAYVEILSDRWSGSTTTPFSVWAEIDVHTNGLVRRSTPLMLVPDRRGFMFVAHPHHLARPRIPPGHWKQAAC